MKSEQTCKCGGNCGCQNSKEFNLTLNSYVWYNDPRSDLMNDDVKNLEDKKISYKYAEDQIISYLKDYIDNTYLEHYKTELNSIECFDAWIALGDSTPTFRNTAIKYLWRYGKKNGNNKKDLMKALHYVMMCLYVDHYRKDDKR